MLVVYVCTQLDPITKKDTVNLGLLREPVILTQCRRVYCVSP